MKLALERHEKGETRVLPIIVRDCQWHKAPFGRLEPLPKNSMAVKESPSLDHAWRTVADGPRGGGEGNSRETFKWVRVNVR
jgi:hypothetical protein